MVYYDSVSKEYINCRIPDKNIETKIKGSLSGASEVLNIGAGAGSYEQGIPSLLAVEPSWGMIQARENSSAPVIQSRAESLPIRSKVFSHGLSILSMHHWRDRVRAFEEIKRVIGYKFTAVTWDPSTEPFWLTRDYFPELIDWDRKIFPAMDEFKSFFDKVVLTPLPIPKHCTDGFMAAYWARPELYLDSDVRAAISTFAKIKNVEQGLSMLDRDLQSEAWNEKNGHLLQEGSLDVGYKLVECYI